ncbi:BON domain-containing protein [Cupriavidus agavae]|uniref:Osmotically-inducible protein OsmY n=1 Tax=Cupriavidus agavae TaxID=1001822 RepID=A0A4Q7RDX4_9BURK|nr:BON domain-containing protein [Cupriavidus agavae]RZT31366.1 osmotically-inducible protein OsmY [Cupriavidus agavae]
MFEFLKNLVDLGPRDDEPRQRARREYRDDERGERRNPGRSDGSGESWRDLSSRDRAQRDGEPGYGGAGYFGNSGSGGQSFNGAQRLYPGDPGYREHPTRPVHSSNVVGRGFRHHDRPDDRVLGDVCDRLAMHPGVDVAEVTVEVQSGVVKLGGTVEDRYERRLVEEIAESVSGVRQVENGIRLQPRGAAAPGGDTSPERTLNRS